MELNEKFILKEIINDLTDASKSLVSVLLQLNYFGRLTKNKELIDFSSHEMDGYKSKDCSIPDYRKTISTIEITLQAGYNTHKVDLPVSMLEEPFAKKLRYFEITQGIGVLEQLILDRSKDEKPEPFFYRKITMEILHAFQPAATKLYKSDVRLDVVAAVQKANAYAVIDVIGTVRHRLLAFVMEVAESFGYDIEISSFKQNQELNNKTIIHFMKTEITNTGDGNVVNTGNEANVTSHINIAKGDFQKLKESLLSHGVEDSDLQQLEVILNQEEPDFENKKLGEKANGWLSNVFQKALNGVGKIGTAAVGNIVATLIKQYYGIHN